MRALVDSCRADLAHGHWEDCIRKCRDALACDLAPAVRDDVQRMFAKSVLQLESSSIEDLQVAVAYWRGKRTLPVKGEDSVREANLAAGYASSMLASAMMRESRDDDVLPVLEDVVNYYEESMTCPEFDSHLRASIHAQAGFALRARGKLRSFESCRWARVRAHLGRSLQLFDVDSDEHREVAAVLEQTPVAPCEETPVLVSASSAGELQEVIRLLASGSNLDDADGAGNTALHVAAGEGHLEIVRALMQAGASRSVLDNDGAALLHWSVLADGVAVLSMLLGTESRIDRVDFDGRTPLSWAASQLGWSASVALLVNAGADVNRADYAYWTPLHHAAGIGDRASVELLLQGRSNVERKTITGETALEIAIRAGHGDVAKTLEAALPHEGMR